MKLYCLTAALLLAGQAKAATEPAFGPHLGVSYVYALLSSLIHDFKEAIEGKTYDKGNVIFFAKVGVNGIGNDGKPVSSGGNSGTEGPFPSMSVWSISNTNIATVQNKLPMITSGGYRPVSGPVNDPTSHYRFSTTAWDYMTGMNAVCISSFSVMPDGASPTNSYSIPAEVIISMDPTVPWTYSGDDSYIQLPNNGCKSIRVPNTCIWMSQFVKPDYTPVVTFTLYDLPNYFARSKEAIARLPKPENVRIVRASKEPPKRRKRDLDIDSLDYVVSGYQSAKFLCESEGSVGPSFLSTSEDLFCHMANNYKDLYYECTSTGDLGCYRLKNGTITLVAKSRNNGGELIVSSPFSVMPLNTDTPAPAPTLRKRAECVPGKALLSLKVGEVLAINDYLKATTGGFQAVVTSTGDVLVYDSEKDENPATNAVWKLGGSAAEGAYTAEVKKNGQLCTRSTIDNVLVKCTGPKFAEGPAYTLTLTPNGYLYIKNGAQVVWTTDPRTTLPPQDVNGYVLTPTNSFLSLDSVNPGTLFKSTDGTTKMEYNKDGSLCIYNKLGYNTWCLDKPAGTMTQVWLSLSSRGNLCTNRVTGGPLNARCTGNLGEETGYFAVLHNDGFLRIYNSAEELLWQRGGGHYFQNRNTLRAGAFRDQDGDLRSDNNRYSIYAHSQGGIVVKDNTAGSIIWSIGGGISSGGPFTMEFGTDGNLCTGRKSDHAHLNCITNVSKPTDKYLLYMENNGRAYIYRPDGTSAWNS
ncbi:hypothetical protein BGW39_005251 [Mortierella sp. 14UC]|nr:hypothetical protein BGW39_005251 [Mortierella sp. 14UC]